MRRFACAALAVLALMPAWPVFAQNDDKDDAGTDVEQQDHGKAKDQDKDEDKEEAKGGLTGDTNEDANRPGFYLGLAGTWAHQKFEDSNNIKFDDSIGFNARAGYRALSWLSAEVQGEWLANFNVDLGPEDGWIEIHDLGANLRLNLPTGLIQPYALLGGGWMHADLRGVHQGNIQKSFTDGANGDGGFGRFGGGMELYPKPWLAVDLGVAYVLPTGDVRNLEYLSITWGFLYRF
ncbi:MAG TPA: outer membrane beta-barrel protein [Myxococcota bacterium]|nr:outer membrane beta-barrel protein [Myxococcota bacterium]